VATAGRLRSVVRSGDLVARFAGDEFVVLCVGSPGSSAVAAPALARRMATTLSAPLVVAGTEVTVSASVGIAVADCDSSVDIDLRDADELLREADAAMYRCKRATSVTSRVTT
jgi:diguanylate cyclase (GGDEF)-like protein